MKHIKMALLGFTSTVVLVSGALAGDSNIQGTLEANTVATNVAIVAIGKGAASQGGGISADQTTLQGQVKSDTILTDVAIVAIGKGTTAQGGGVRMVN